MSASIVKNVPFQIKVIRTMDYNTTLLGVSDTIKMRAKAADWPNDSFYGSPVDMRLFSGLG